MVNIVPEKQLNVMLILLFYCWLVYIFWSAFITCFHSDLSYLCTLFFPLKQLDKEEEDLDLDDEDDPDFYQQAHMPI